MMIESHNFTEKPDSGANAALVGESGFKSTLNPTLHSEE